MTRHDQEPGRAFGMPRDRIGPGRRGGQGEEPQHALGLPVDWFGGVDTEFFRSLLHPIKGYRRWSRRRRLGAYALDDDGTGRG
jgi:hypothetical protein